MKRVAEEAGVPAEDIFMDHAGFSTYESMYRARDVFGAKRIVIVSQEYHLHRALYVAKALGLEAYGVSADLRPYAGQQARDLREILARNKDFATAILQPEPTFLGDPISLSGSGSITEG
ncbi:vancomycin high temperature exclusion protein [uncultured Adlercreutzia sp.]|uniref:SanA/YdcF family protein n=1 Tax=uncultured Adlercreutzia sp. TaxID=875803 RepID=UPI0026F390CC|nr:ElyC/SanA/YdcF family protein [uncultured Adlercreutzia sp.]